MTLESSNKAIITIGVPVFNEAKYLGRTIESILTQSYSQLRIIIADNCSTDGSYAVAQEYARKDSRVLATQHRTNIDGFNNFKYLLSKAESKYFMFVGGHDQLGPGFIEKAVQLHEAQPDTTLIYGKTIFIDEHGNSLGPADSDIDTSGLDLKTSLIKLVGSLRRCSAISGIFKTEHLTKLPFEKMYGLDWFLLFCIPFYGNITAIDSLGLKRLHKDRGKNESIAQRVKRYKEYGIIPQNEKTLRANQLAVSCIKKVIFSNQLNPRDKTRVVYRLKRFFANKYKLTFGDIVLDFLR